ncbi:secretory lipase [Pochonia chlamydosporia 170]|uniref:Secretory lipase n=1 Tax=Pochonia chlamydosporia 170 TaxID=1380566 RepID=A0A179F3D7_METCM|nr:secretory lipase [Pochonia chlamydosporia 170]OAQ59683.1 secretory lipase [Pochonia chlamydosporia 170]
MFRLQFLFLCAVSLCTQKAVASAVLPVNDPFYTPPAGFETKKAGTILRNRLVPSPLESSLNISSAHQILYRTTNSFGKAIATVSTILVPKNADPSKLLSYQVAEDAASPNCCPSYVAQKGSQSGGAFGTVVTKVELGLINDALEHGWYVTVPDFLGPNAAFLANNLAGYAVLDGIRATLASSSFTGVAADPKTALWGYSGGSLASGFAAELQPVYAPELKIAGAALGGTCPDILSVLYKINKSLYAGLIATGIVGLGNEYPEIASLISSQVVPSKAKAVKQVKNTCLGANTISFAFQDIFKFVKDPSIFNGTTVKAIADANNMGHHTPSIPLMVYKGVKDEISPIADTDSLIQRYCQGGAAVEYRRKASSGHVDLFFSASKEVLAWLKGRLDGVAVQPGCTNTT